MPLVFFLSPTDPRMLATIDAVLRSPEKGGLTSGSLVYRYDTEASADGVGGEEGSFNMCTFWLVEGLTRAGREDRARLERARLIFEQMLGFANHLGLYAEQTGPHGEALGNFPQAFTHLSLIRAAYNLDRVRGGKKIRVSGLGGGYPAGQPAQLGGTRFAAGRKPVIGEDVQVRAAPAVQAPRPALREPPAEVRAHHPRVDGRG
jgi:hypothetical protein